MNRICRRFQRRGWIDLDRTGIHVLDPHSPRAYADRGLRPCTSHREGELTRRLVEARAELADMVVEAMPEKTHGSRAVGRSNVEVCQTVEGPGLGGLFGSFRA